MATPDELALGTQVVYMPQHANEDPNHPDCEEGFVTSVKGGHAYVRYWSKTHQGLRTLANGELTPICALIVKETHPQHVVDHLLQQLGYT